jgi:signal transduction histidine kinase
MKLSLRSRVLLIVFLVNALVFGAGGLYLYRLQVEGIEDQEVAGSVDLVRTVQKAIRPDRLNVANILRWPYWGDFTDALFVDASLGRNPAGELDVRGIALNPLGARARARGFERERVLAALRESIDGDRVLTGVEGGRVVPIAHPAASGPSAANPSASKVWGAVWFRTKFEVDRGWLVARLLPWFLLSTLLLTLVNFVALRRLVLAPIELLAGGARRLRGGEFGTRLAEPARRDEMADLVRSFNEMAGTVQGFHEHLGEEVRRATEKTRAAEAAAMVQRRLAAMGELAAGLAHEINNPLGGLRNAVEVLRSGKLTDEKRERYFDLLAQGLERIGETVQRLRRFTPRAAPHEPVDLAAVARDALELVRHRAERLGVALELANTAGEAVVPGARNEIGQALLNLLSNALDALEAGSSDRRGPRIRVAVERAPTASEIRGVRVTVRDNGPGVGPEDLPRISDLFYTTKEVGKGTGLGLALVHRCLAEHGGRVAIESEAGRYFEVELLFPESPGASREDER